MEIYEKLIREYSTEPILEEALGSFFINRKEKKLQNLAIRKSLLQQKVNIFLVWLNRTAKLASRKVFSVKSSVPYVLLQVILIYSFLNII